jgi:hypothetical protein
MEIVHVTPATIFHVRQALTVEGQLALVLLNAFLNPGHGRNVLLLAIIQDRDDEGEAPVKTRKFQTDPLPNAGSLQGRPAGAPSHDAACAADVTRAMRRSPLGPVGMMYLKNNEAPANGRGCVADASHVS